MPDCPTKVNTTAGVVQPCVGPLNKVGCTSKCQVAGSDSTMAPPYVPRAVPKVKNELSNTSNVL